MKKQMLTGIISISFLSICFAQVGVGTTNPDSSAILDVSSTTKGFLPPRMTTSERDAIMNPEEGLQIYNSTTDCLEFYVNGSWRSIRCGNTYILSVSKAGTGTGTITSAPGGINCGMDCSENIMDGTMVVLTATPSANSTFAGWSGGGCSGTGQCAVSMTAAQSVVATFNLNSYALTVAKTGTGTGTVTSAPAGINCGIDCTENYTTGTMVTLTATPSPTSSFSGWSGGGCSGTGNCVTTMNNAQNVTANFQINTYQLTTIAGGMGSGVITSSPTGIYCGYTCGTTYNAGTFVTLTASPFYGYNFAGWSGSGCSGTGNCNVLMDGPKTVQALFNLNTYPLSVSRSGTGDGEVHSMPSGISCGTACEFNYDYNSMVTLITIPAPGSTFSGWSGSGCSGTGNCTVTMNGAQNVNAAFSLIYHPLTVSLAGNGAGSVTSSPAGINCGSTCTASYPESTMITLVAAPSTGSTFIGWSGGGCSGTGNCDVTMSSAQNVTALFQLQTFSLNVTMTGNGSQYSVVYSSPVGIYCGVDCSETYNFGSIVTLTAVPGAQDIIFDGWSGGGCSGTDPCLVLMNNIQNVTATFTFIP